MWSLFIELQLNEKANPLAAKKILNLIQTYEVKIQKYESEKSEIKKQAEEFQKEYDILNIHDDQFDLAEALISLTLSLLGITALLQKKSLFYFSLTFASIGIFFGMAGFMNLSVHPDIIMRFLG